MIKIFIYCLKILTTLLTIYIEQPLKEVDFDPPISKTNQKKLNTFYHILVT